MKSVVPSGVLRPGTWIESNLRSGVGLNRSLMRLKQT